jgi:hypothetical protein
VGGGEGDPPPPSQQQPIKPPQRWKSTCSPLVWPGWSDASQEQQLQRFKVAPSLERSETRSVVFSPADDEREGGCGGVMEAGWCVWSYWKA